MMDQEVAKTGELNKEIRLFLNDIDLSQQLNIQGQSITFSDFLSNKLLLVLAIREGIPYSIFSLIQNNTPFTINDWADYLNLSNKSLQRYRQQNKKFKPIYSEKILELAEVTNLGLEIFGDLDKFKLWLETPNYAFGNLKPYELLKDSYGKEMIINELTRIDHGIFV
ncbi:MAG: antitoxin [Bacteroidetes bacterium]|nr:MAG: antitoxin [Bacteroidota bacterium]